MDRLRRTLSFRSRKKKRKYQTESTKPHQWQEDEKKVRDGTCSFQVKYLGCVEVFESRGMQVCEEAHKVLRSNSKKSHRLSFRKKPKSKQKAVQAILYISGDSLRVVEDKAGITSADDTQGLIVDQTIEKVSFCAPDREHEKGFSYICRDGTTRRWMCHGFLALKESGERLSHAVGCAFAVCLEKKQKREKEAVTVNYSEDKTSFSRLGSFRQATLTERLADPQSTKVVDAQPQAARPDVEIAQVERPRASQDLLLRQGSFREFTKLNSQTSPFKRNLSLRLNELPSNVSRQQADFNTNVPIIEGDEQDHAVASPSQNAESTNKEFDPIAEMCQQLSQGITGLSEENKSSTVTTTTTTVNSKVANLASANNTSSAINGVKAAQDPIDPWAKDADFFTSPAPAPAVQAQTSPVLQPQPVNTTPSTVRPRPMTQTQLSNQSATGFSISTNQSVPNNNTTPQKYVPNGHSVGLTAGPTSPLTTQNNPDNPFDTTWAIKTTSTNNPFLTNTQTTTTANSNHHQFSKEFELKM